MYISDRHPSKTVLIWEHALPIALCLAFLVVVLYTGQSYIVGSYNNSDFFSMYAPDANHIANGDLPQNTFNGPGYPLLLSAVSTLTGDHFISGKWIAAFSASLCGLVAFYLLQGLFNYRTAILGLLIMLVSGDFAVLSIDPGTDLIFLLLCLTAIFIFTHNEIGVWQKAMLAGAIGGLAYLTRYNGVFLPATFLVSIVIFNSFGVPLLKRFQMAVLHIFTFLATISPWLWLNYKHHGSPLYNTNYLNMATEFYGYKFDWDGVTQAATVFHSFGDVVLHDPKGFVLHYFGNIVETLQKSLSSEFIVVPLGVLAIVAIPVVLIKGSRNEVWVFLLSALLYFLVMCFNHWESRYYFYVMVCYIGLACYLIVSGADWLTSKGWLPQRVAQVGLLCIALLVFYISAIGSSKDIKKLIRSQPYELSAASEYIRSVSAKGVRIMARKPNLAYMSNGVRVFFPQVKSLDELHDALQKTPADYLVYDKIALALRPELKILADPVNIIPWLKPVYSDLPKSLVIYHVEMTDSELAPETR